MGNHRPGSSTSLISLFDLLILHSIDLSMRPTTALWQHSARITLFTRSNCSLCDTAKSTINQLATRRSFDLAQIDIMAPDQTQWKDLYEFDAPVVRSCVLAPPLSIPLPRSL